jgi:hypothetical protein
MSGAAKRPRRPRRPSWITVTHPRVTLAERFRSADPRPTATGPGPGGDGESLRPPPPLPAAHPGAGNPQGRVPALPHRPPWRRTGPAASRSAATCTTSPVGWPTPRSTLMRPSTPRWGPAAGPGLVRRTRHHHPAGADRQRWLLPQPVRVLPLRPFDDLRQQAPPHAKLTRRPRVYGTGATARSCPARRASDCGRPGSAASSRSRTRSERGRG